MATAFTTPAGVISFPNTHKPRPRSEDGAPVYSLSILFDKAAQSTAAYKALFAECERLAKEISAEKKINLSAVRLPFLDAGEKAGQYQGYAPGVTYISPWSKFKPGVVGPDREDIIDGQDIFAGQMARVNVTPFKWSKSGKHGVSFGLNAVQILKLDAERLDGRKSAKQIFDDGMGFDDDNVF